MNVYVATLETANYRFDAFGATPADAGALMRAALAKHAAISGADLDFLLEAYRSDGVVRWVPVGTVLRDGAELISPEVDA